MKELYPLIRHRQILLDISTCESLAMLMRGGFSLRDAMDVMDDTQLHEVFEGIRRRLETGDPPDQFLSSFCTAEIRGYLDGFLSYMTVSAAMSAACSVIRQEHRQKEILVKGSLYPCLLCAGMLAGIFLFATFVLPAMLGLMKGLGIEGSEKYELIRIGVRVIAAAMFLLICTFAAAAAYLVQPSRIERTYRFLAARFRDSFFVISASRDFARFFLECVRMNVPTIQALAMLKKLKGRPLVALIAGELDSALKEGQELTAAMNSPYVETALCRFMRIAVFSSECEAMLEGYLEMTGRRTEKKIRSFSRTVQLFSYTLIGIVLIFVYRILMMPMVMLQKI